MNGIHDLGGMDGFGPPDHHEHEGAFGEPWEGGVYSLFVATLGNGLAELDEFRYAIERMPPETYLDASYYERWLGAFETLLLEAGVIDPEEVEERVTAFETEEMSRPAHESGVSFAALADGVADAYSSRREGREPRFAAGERVRVRREAPRGHTRCPRYARGATGTVDRVVGTHVLPDANAHGEAGAEPVYTVGIEAEELWGSEGETNGSVHLDLWESYLGVPE
ncbi:nitrile hydratase subunit beta [Natronorarus salvus]|uniref:nitrile hydratase subunit beta n=1 Tax=Natronorarus salvus TaxID=3117733 RepID=UPI002F26BE0A